MRATCGFDKVAAPPTKFLINVCYGSLADIAIALLRSNHAVDAERLAVETHQHSVRPFDPIEQSDRNNAIDSIFLLRLGQRRRRFSS